MARVDGGDRPQARREPDALVQHGRRRRRPGVRPLHAQQGPVADDPPGIPDSFGRFRWLEETDEVELRGRAWVGGGVAPRSVEVSLDAGATWSPAPLEPAPGPFAWSGWSFRWRDVRPGQSTLLTRATDANGNGQDLEETWICYAMDHTKPQAVDVDVLPRGTLEPGTGVTAPNRFPTL